jgi:hypothetical protein
MPSVQCLGCGREIEFSNHEIGQRFECAACGAGVVATASTSTPRVYFDVPPTRPKLPAGLVAGAVVVAGCFTLLVVVVGLVLVSPSAGQDGSGEHVSPPAPAQRLTVTELSIRYAADPDAAERDLAGKTLEVTGTAYNTVDGVVFLDVPRNMNYPPGPVSPAEMYNRIAQAAVADFPLNVVKCRLKDARQELPAHLKNKTVTIRGTWETRDKNHDGKMVGCEIISR